MTEQVNETKERARPWLWPGEWFKDEKFWREVTARALSGIIVLVLAALGAVAAGLIVQPQFVQRLVATILMILCYLVLTSRLAAAKLFQRQTSKPTTPARQVLYFFLFLAWLAGFVFFTWAANSAELFF